MGGTETQLDNDSGYNTGLLYLFSTWRIKAMTNEHERGVVLKGNDVEAIRRLIGLRLGETGATGQRCRKGRSGIGHGGKHGCA